VSDAGTLSLVQRVQQAREALRAMARDGFSQQTGALFDLAEQAYLSAGRLSQQATSAVQQGVLSPTDRYVLAQMAELRHLGEVLARLGYAAQDAQRQSGASMGELDGLLDRIAQAAAPSAGPAPSAASGAPPGVQTQEVTRLASGFAQDIAALCRQLMHITNEMRDGLAPFRLEAETAEGATLYAPGTGSDDPPALDAHARAWGYHPGDPRLS
jgi:hypothetical protein